MLRIIYPNEKTPLTASFETLCQCLEIAHKYDLEGMLGTIDDQLAINTASQSLIHQDPLRAYGLSVQFILPKTKASAISLVVLSVSDPSELAGLIQSHPSTNVTHLAAIQGTQGKMLADVLPRFYQRPVLPLADYPNMFYDLSCNFCQRWMDKCERSPTRKGMRPENPPSWIIAWIDMAYETLLRACLENSDKLFEWITLQHFRGETVSVKIA
ncbi:hypothetical protein BDV93DRAFT_556569 [Ceratobasidium sp. AG-I]|nr:hypothetical protein BDV93DRAFT_556569 [Ceratobasidium sp. AG-I]